MAFFKRIQKKINNLWYPQSVTVGKPVTTDQIADQLAILSTVTRGDTYAVMKNLGTVLGNYMAQGRSVKVDGVGTFYYTASSSKKGVEKVEDVSASQIAKVRVRFIPEIRRNSSSQVTTRSMVDSNIFWEEWGGSSTSGENSGNEGGNTGGGTGTGDGGDNEGTIDENPLG
ncbi:MAG: DNA-binding protein [Bacteroides sp.]|jgi:predicted histone-like DNA-binding protein|nr:DNA-binding protein [Bacteroides sp.]MCI1681939.1 DNA-binding protein [Bacteroides sp.]